MLLTLDSLTCFDPRLTDGRSPIANNNKHIAVKKLNHKYTGWWTISYANSDNRDVIKLMNFSLSRPLRNKRPACYNKDNNTNK